MTQRVRMGWVAAALLVATLASAAVLDAKEPPRPAFAEKRATAFDAAVEAERKRQGLIGLAVAVIENNKLTHVGCYGLADQQAKRPVTGETLFRWASISKPLTAVAALQLLEKKKLKLSDTARSHCKDLPKDGLGLVTVEQLLSHRAGVGHYREMGNWKTRLAKLYGDRASVSWDAKKSVAVLSTQALAFPAGAKFHYTTFGFNLLGGIVESAGKEPFEKQVANRIAGPLGMTSLEPDYEFVKRSQRTAGYRKKSEKIVPSEVGDVSWKLPGGGFHSTIGDLARFGIGLLDGKLLSKETQAELWRPRADEGKESGYALGFSVRMRNGKVARVSHSGAQARARTLLLIEPQTRRGVAIMTNSEWGDPNAVRKAAFRALGW